MVRGLAVAEVRAGRLDDLRETDHGDQVVVLDRAAVDLFEEATGLVEPAELGVVVLDVAAARLASGFTSTSSITAAKIFSRGLWRKPIVTQTSWPRSYLPLLSPTRIVAVLRPRFSWSPKTAE